MKKYINYFKRGKPERSEAKCRFDSKNTRPEINENNSPERIAERSEGRSGGTHSSDPFFQIEVLL